MPAAFPIFAAASFGAKNRFVFIQPREELFVPTPVDFPQFDQNTGSDIQLTGFVLGIGGAANVAAAAL